MSAPRWPDDWEARKAGHNCPLCATVGQGDDDHAITVIELPFTEVRLERRSRLPGYCIAVWRHGHIAEPTELDAGAAAGYWLDVLAVARAIEDQYRPVKLNLLTLGNWVPHLHTHVVPRYHDDPAPGGPIPWDAIFTDEPAAADDLRRQADALHRVLQSRADR
jgi:diadenosine tetraphosphate (Ap4A) HIT family hydrolase